MAIKAGEPGSRSSNLVGLRVAIDLHSSSEWVKCHYAKVGVLAGAESDYEIDRLPDDIPCEMSHVVPRKVLSECLHLYSRRTRSYLLRALEGLCRDAEAGVRENAVKTLVNIGMRMNKSDMLVLFIPMIKRLAGDDLATARVSACTLLFVPYETSSTWSKVEHRSAYAALCRDGNPLVRREAAANLWRFANGPFEHDVMSLLEHLAKDANEFVRSAAIQSCGALQDLIVPSIFEDHILPLIAAGSEDTSPCVREMVANQLHHFCEVEVGFEDSLPIHEMSSKAAFTIPLPTLQSVLGVIAVGALVYGTYHGVSSLKQLVESIETNGKEVVGQLNMARENWTAEGCPVSIKIYPEIFWKKKT